LLTLVQDISELERAEEARRESEQRFRQLADAIDDVFWLTDASKRQMIYVSPAYARIWGRPCEQLYAEPQSWLDAVHPDDVDRVRAAVPSQAQGAFELEYRIVRPDGAVRRINERAFPVRNAAGMVYRIAGVASDITSRRELEEQFRQSQKMEAIGQLAGGIAHDFNNLLTVIELQSAALAEAQHNDPETSAGIHQILEASRRAANLTRQLLTFSRRQTHAARDVDLGEVLGGVTKMLRRILGEDITLESRFAPGLRPVHADPGMMEQVLMNLAVNARDAMPRGGRLLIALEPVTLDASAAAARHSARVGSFVCLSVSDTGCGIPPQIRDRIFEPFFTTKEIGKGTGLGLATVFGIVEQHGGWIELESTVGAGTTFRVFLPALSEAAAESRPAPAMPDLRGGTETILLVEDEDSVRLLAAASLRQRGYRVIEAANAREAFERWSQAEGRVDLLLTDLIMPGGLSGKDLVDQVLQAGSRVRIVYASGHSTSVVGRQLDLRPGINFLEKPYSIADLATIVRNRLDSPVSPAS
jgi:PAS domain S-box-containing protein